MVPPLCYNNTEKRKRISLDGIMSAKFAEKILDGIVDENGMCTERGLSRKQFDVVSAYLAPCEWEYVTSWMGNRGVRKDFYTRDFIGNIGKYRVILNEYSHFNDRLTVKSIVLRPAEDVERENNAREMAKFENSDWVFEPKQRVNPTLTLVRQYEYSAISYSGYGTERRFIYAFTDEDGNCYVWKTTAIFSDSFKDAKVGDTVDMRATVKENGEYRGIRQTVLTRCKVNKIR